jgi:hypothetical protein
MTSKDALDSGTGRSSQGVPTTTGLFGEAVSAAVVLMASKIVVVTLPSKVVVTAAAGSAVRGRKMRKDTQTRNFIYFRELSFHAFRESAPTCVAFLRRIKTTSPAPDNMVIDGSGTGRSRT